MTELTMLQQEPARALTRQEQQVVKLVAEGKTDHKIANILALKCSTVKTYLRSIRQKLQARNRVEIVRWYYKLVH